MISKTIKGITIEIDGNTKPLGEALKDVSKLGSELNTELNRTNSLIKLDPKDINQWKLKQDNLNRSIDNTNERLSRLKLGQAAANQEFLKGNITKAQYDEIGKETTSAEYLLSRFKKELENTNGKISSLNVDRFEKLNQKLEKTKSLIQPIARAAQIALAAITAGITKGIMTGDELSDMATKYGATAEKIQIQRNLYEKAADGAEGYDSVLTSISSVLKSLERDSTRYNSILAQINLTVADFKGLTVSEAYDLIYNSLKNVTDESQRYAIANAILGDSGLNLATIAGLTEEEVNNLNAALIDAGIITNDQASKADQLANKLDDVKLKGLVLAVSLMEALEPAINAIINGVSRLTEWLSGLSDGGVQAIVIVMFIVAIIPKLISLIQGIIWIQKQLAIATYEQAAATGTLTAAGFPLWIVLAAIAAVVLSLIILFASLSKKTKDVTSDIKNMTSELMSIDGISAQVEAQQKAVISSNVVNNEVIDVNVNVKFDGDTPISSSNARQIADYISPSIVDAVNKQMLINRQTRRK